MTTGISHKMHLALEAVRNGATARDACEQIGVSRQALYRAMRRENIGTRCKHCGHILTARQTDAEADAVAKGAEDAGV